MQKRGILLKYNNILYIINFYILIQNTEYKLHCPKF